MPGPFVGPARHALLWYAGEAEPASSPPDADTPVRDAKERVLTFGTWRLESGKGADSQEAVLAAFQADGWPSAVRESLPFILGGILRTMKKQLGNGSPIAFVADGKGGVRWKPK